MWIRWPRLSLVDWVSFSRLVHDQLMLGYFAESSKRSTFTFSQDFRIWSMMQVGVASHRLHFDVVLLPVMLHMSFSLP